MAPRARVPLLCVYALLALCGLISIFTPLQTVENAVAVPVLVKIWGGFFLVGGAISFAALVSRMIYRHALGWWYIEISGICLLATSSLMYASVLATLVLKTHSFNIAGLSCLIMGLACSLIGRALDAYQIAKIEKKILEELALRDREV